MRTLENVAELVDSIGDVLTSEDPIAELRSRGIRFAPELEEQLNAERNARALSATARKRWAQVARSIGPVRYRVHPITPIERTLPEGEYDLMVAVRLSVIVETLAGLYDTLTWPRQIEPESAGRLFEISDLRDFSGDVPEGNNISVGSLNFNAPPTVTAADGTDNLVVHQPFSLEIDRLLPTFVVGGGSEFRRVNVTSLTGILHFGARISADVDNNSNELRFTFDGVVNVTPELALRIDVDPSSPLRPRDDQAIADLEEEVQVNFNLAVLTDEIRRTYSICPVVSLPFDSGQPIRIQRVDIRNLVDDDGVLIAGVLLGPTSDPDENAGDPDRLTNPFATDSANANVRLHEVLLRKVIQQAYESGELERVARQENNDLRIDGADVELRTNEIRLVIDGRLVDVCGPPLLRFKDLGFRATRTYRYAVFGGEIVVTQDQDINLDNNDVALCVILGAFEALIAGAVFNIYVAIADIIAQIVHFVRLRPSGGSDDPIRIKGVFDSSLPVPGTELLPRAEALQALVEDDSLRATGAIGLKDDDVNTYVYAAFKRRVGFLGLQLEPITQAQVKLIDQDVPRPPGDDVRIPISEERIISTARRLVTVRTEFEPPIANQVLAEGSTDDDGAVNFLLRPDQIRTTAGTLVTTRITVLLDRPRATPQTHTTRREIAEAQPDVFFNLKLSDGRIIDSRMLASGLILNLTSKRIGSAANPLTFVVGGGGRVDFG